jgi:hypothetical protein
LRLTGIDVTSTAFNGGGSELVRRFHLTHDSNYHVSMLASVRMEGKYTASPVDALAVGGSSR